jgi:hypothetical protein
VNSITLNALSFGARFNQNYFIKNTLPDIIEARGRIFYRFRRRAFFVHVDNLMCHNGRKVIDEPDNLKLDRVPHPPYSSNLTL